MFSLRFTRIPTGIRSCLLQNRKQNSAAQIAPASEKELINHVADDVEYPEILDLSYPARHIRNYEKIGEFIKRQKTVEEKAIAINMPRYYGFTVVKMFEHIVHYNSLEQTQFLTRTHIMPTNGLPSFYNDLISTDELDKIVGNIRSQIEDVLVLEYAKRNIKKELPADVVSNQEELQKIQTKAIIRQINRILFIELSRKYPHLLETEVDIDPRLEAFWTVGGMDPPKSIVYKKRKSRLLKDYAEDPIDRYFQYFGEPCLQLRHALPLREMIPHSETENPDYIVPEYKYDPLTVGYQQGIRHGTNIPGFWPGDKNEFGLLSYHHCNYMTNRPRDYDDEEIALKTQAIRACYAWLHTQANYQGFSTYNDVTYPLLTQNVILNGQWWFFSVYQLNTTLFSNHHIDDNPKRNLYWTTGPMQLFEKIEDNKVHGLNDEVLKNLIKMYINEPQQRDVEMKPYLGLDEKVVADIQDDEKRKWLEELYKKIMSCRGRYLTMPEIFHWQEIYMRKFKQRPMEKKLQPWQNRINILLRKMDDHPPRYLPKALRPHPRSKAKFQKTFYPQ